MAPHSSTPAWQIPWTEEPGGLQSMGLLGVGYNSATSLSLFTFMHWRRKWQPTPVFLPGESQGRGSLVGCCLWGHTESDMTEETKQQQQQQGPENKFLFGSCFGLYFCQLDVFSCELEGKSKAESFFDALVDATDTHTGFFFSFVCFLQLHSPIQ